MAFRNFYNALMSLRLKHLRSVVRDFMGLSDRSLRSLFKAFIGSNVRVYNL